MDPLFVAGLVSLHDRAALERWLRRDPRLHLYELGDLDDFFWPHTTWYGLEDRSELLAVALLYTAGDPAVVVALGASARELVARLANVLPRRFYAHLELGATAALGSNWNVAPRGVHDRMILTQPSQLDEVESKEAITLTAVHASELETFYASAYPGNWFDKRMLDTGGYRAVKRDGKIVSVAGVHVLSRRYRVGALGNVATNAAFRGRGLGRIVCAALCKDLVAIAEPVGLNVLSSNAAAVALYQQLGFTRVA
ncbi:MAG TPA: GNAT family N-acetyltransferase, partial [Labilithrix sp.]